MLSRVAQLRPGVSRLMFYSASRFVSNSQPSGAAASAVVPELQRGAPAAEPGEVSQYFKVSRSCDGRGERSV